MAWRNITVDGKSYRWRCGGNVIVQNAAGKRVAFGSAAKVIGVSENDYERGQWKKTCDGMVTPSAVARFIREAVN